MRKTYGKLWKTRHIIPAINILRVHATAYSSNAPKRIARSYASANCAHPPAEDWPIPEIDRQPYRCWSSCRIRWICNRLLLGAQSNSKAWLMRLRWFGLRSRCAVSCTGLYWRTCDSGSQVWACPLLMGFELTWCKSELSRGLWEAAHVIIETYWN